MFGTSTSKICGTAFGAVLVAASFVAVPQTAFAATDVVGPACTRTLVGSVEGNQTVGAGEVLCLRGAVVGGTITVNAGGALDSKNSRVNGAISMTGATSFIMCNSSVIGAVAANGGGQISIGDNHACVGSYIDGAVSLIDNVGGLRIAGSVVTGEVTVNDNRTNAPAGPRVADNEIGGALACSGNTPAPTNTGRSNTVVGAKSGQCRAVKF